MNETTTIPPDTIRVPDGRERAPDDLDVRALARSLSELGMLHPLTVAQDGDGAGFVLIAGARRLAAARSLGWAAVPVRVFDAGEVGRALAELDENLCRSDLTALERAEALARRKELHEARYPETRPEVRRLAGLRHGDAAPPRADIVSARETPQAFTSEAADLSGLDARTLRRGVQIATGIPSEVRDLIRGTPVADNQTELLRLARLPHDQQAAAARALADGSARNVRGAVVRATAARIASEPPPLPGGRFRVIVADPPWRYDARPDDATHRSALPYPSMADDEIVALPVGELADADAILFLWTTNAHIPVALRCLDAWGFTLKTVLTWVKDRIGTGQWLRGQTELCILAVRGRPVVTLSNQSTALVAPRREHSRKPDEFYALVESLCPGAKLELFARQTRPGWRSWGGEADRFDDALDDGLDDDALDDDGAGVPMPDRVAGVIRVA